MSRDTQSEEEIEKQGKGRRRRKERETDRGRHKGGETDDYEDEETELGSWEKKAQTGWVFHRQ